jgi:hypothetical protein
MSSTDLDIQTLSVAILFNEELENVNLVLETDTVLLYELCDGVKEWNKKCKRLLLARCKSRCVKIYIKGTDCSIDVPVRGGAGCVACTNDEIVKILIDMVGEQ